MKWLSLLILLALGGAFLYWYFGDSTSAWQGTRQGPAKDFIYAAVEGDYELATFACVPEIADEARRVAERIDAEDVDPRAIVFKETADSANTLTALVNGRILTIKVSERATDDWVIVGIDLGR